MLRFTNEKNKTLTFYRIKLEFEIGSVSYPVGAIRLFSAEDVAQMSQVLFQELNPSQINEHQLFNNYFEEVTAEFLIQDGSIRET